ncbi:ferredoxin--NADP+ reductase [Nocardioides sp. YR527]|uniref:FAD-dependent oxidoreductase n=1 Tax=Nocardioides sp. YR527 TaxID=1881028 RepID=UPI00088FE515|nr:FAD-dependent oxidoreductase [Nocardioides sp. YR527]SDK65821.1 ferredoxin--NADP+ reductase [Nocardioides sp. YR527]
MTHVVTRACCNDASCVPVCPVNCIHPTPDEPDYGTAEMLYIDPDACIDCGACVEACPVGAISADYDLAADQEPYERINASWFDGDGRRDYAQEPVPSRPTTWAGRSGEQLRVAIVGSGPAASYAAEELLSRRGLDVAVDMYERLPIPGGLVRFGVAPDHQDTKQTSVAFARTLKRKGLRLFLNTEVGRDITVDELRASYHAVIVAVGALDDRRLGIPGEDLPGSHSATELVGWYNGHPDFAHRTFDLSSERAVVVGNGNVALDVARILASDPERLAGTDIADHALAQLRESNVREVVVVGRRGPQEAAFTTKELLGLIQTPGIDVVVRSEELTPAEAEPGSAAAEKQRLLQELCSRPLTEPRRVVLRFLASPEAVLGDDWVAGIRLQANRLEADASGVVRPVPTGDLEELACGLVFRSIGYRGSAVPGVPFDEVRAVVPNTGGRVHEAGEPVPGLFVTGWIKRGPSGVIGTNKQCARETVAHLLADFDAGTLPAPQQASDDIESRLPGHVGLEGWRQIDTYETGAGRAARRPRVKLVDIEEMLTVARSGAGA